MSAKIFESEPGNFINKHDVVSCFCEYDGKILLLLRADHKSEGNKWGPPAGKVDPGEKIEEAVRREVFEETGLDIPTENFAHLKKLYVRYPEYDFVYHVFKTSLERMPEIKISPKEHKSHSWISPLEDLKIELVKGQDLVNRLIYGAA